MKNKVIHLKNIANELYYSTEKSSKHVEVLANASYHEILTQNLENMLIDCFKNSMNSDDINEIMETAFLKLRQQKKAA